jgi:molybdenum-dependent DNA-binding transcriptional regulator ModE
MSLTIARRVLVVAALASAALLTLPAFAHGPSRQKVVEKIEIEAPADKVWAIVGNFQDASWIPAVEKTEGAGGSAEGAKRKLTVKGGGVIEESVTKHDDAAKALGYKIDNVDVKVLPVNNYSATISVKEEGGKSVVEWKGAFYRGFMNNDPPPDQSDEAALKAVTDLYKAGLASLKAKAEGK